MTEKKPTKPKAKKKAAKKKTPAKKKQPEKLPEGKIRTVEGTIIDRAGAAFYLSKTNEDPDIRISQNNTVYRRDKNGTLRRISKKMNKKERRRVKENA